MTRGDYEFVTSPDGISHILVCTRVTSVSSPRDGDTDLQYTFSCPCGAIGNPLQANTLVIANAVNCIKCALTNFGG